MPASRGAQPRRLDPLAQFLIIVLLAGLTAGFLFRNTLYLHIVRGYSPALAGLLILPMAAATVIASPLSGRLVAAGRGRWALVGGGTAIAAAALITLSPATPVAELAVVYAVFGIGFGLVNPPISNTAVSGMPAAQAGVAASVASTSRQVGSAPGVAITGRLLAGHTAAGFTAASHPGWTVIAACGLAVVLTGLVSTSRWAPPERAAHP